jgi:hypothetical protein
MKAAHIATDAKAMHKEGKALIRCCRATLDAPPQSRAIYPKNRS